MNETLRLSFLYYVISVRDRFLAQFVDLYEHGRFRQELEKKEVINRHALSVTYPLWAEATLSPASRPSIHWHFCWFQSPGYL